jgi:hypothetical protein
MTTQQQQQEPNILQPSVQAAWDLWCDARIKDKVQPVVDEIAKQMDEIVNDTVNELNDVVKEIGKNVVEPATVRFGQHAQKISELLEIVQVLATDNAFLSGRIDQIQREFKGITRELAPKTIERTIATTTEQQSSRVSQTTLSIIDEVLNG